MKITDVQTFLVNADQGGSTDRPHGRNWLFVKLSTDAGVHGIGEAGGWPEVVQKGIEELRYFLVGENPFDVDRLGLKLYDLLHPHGFTGAVRGGVISAIDMALWDIKGKALGVPVWQLLGGRMRDAIRVYGHASNAATARELAERGFTAFKCAPSAATLKEVRAAVGDAVDIGVHCHGELTAAAAVELAEACLPDRPAFFEEPTWPEDIDELAKVHSATRIPLAVGERMYSRLQARPYFERGLLHLIQPEITRIGGISETKRLAILADTYQVLVAPHDGSAGPIAEMANLHVMATIPNFYALEHRATDVPWRSEVVLGVVSDRKGFIVVPDAPGLGLELNEHAIAEHPPRPIDSYQYHIRSTEEIRRTRSS
jgi:galactonate dehydratase